MAAPFATRQLADLGARVIKIERPDAGDFARSYDSTVLGQSSYFVWLNRSKESLTLDMKAPHAADVMAKLLEKADVFIENLAPGAARSARAFGGVSLHERYPRLIVCSVSGYGASGPYASKKAYDLLVQSELGLISLTGTEEHPSKVGISVADISAGMYAYAGILTALLSRDVYRSRDGGPCLAARCARGVDERAVLLQRVRRQAAAAERRASRLDRAVRARTTPAKAAPVYLAIQNAREWTRFCETVLEQPALADDERFRTNPDRVTHRAALDEAIADVFSRLTAEQVLARLDAADIASARLGSIGELASHPQFTARDRWREVESSGGPLKALLPPVVMDDVTPAMAAIPALGQHTDAILGELGFDVATIAAWRAARSDQVVFDMCDSIP